MIDGDEREQIDAQALARVDAAVAFAESSPFPAPESLYDDVYVLSDQVTARTRSDHDARERAPAPELRRRRGRAGAGEEIPQQLTDALAAGEDAGGR